MLFLSPPKRKLFVPPPKIKHFFCRQILKPCSFCVKFVARCICVDSDKVEIVCAECRTPLEPPSRDGCLPLFSERLHARDFLFKRIEVNKNRGDWSPYMLSSTWNMEERKRPLVSWDVSALFGHSTRLKLEQKKSVNSESGCFDSGKVNDCYKVESE